MLIIQVRNHQEKQLKERGLSTMPWSSPHVGDKESAERPTREMRGSPEAVQGGETDHLWQKLLTS